jgi:hypothetical protein
MRNARSSLTSDLIPHVRRIDRRSSIARENSQEESTMISKTKGTTRTESGVRIKSRVRAGGTQMQHNQAAQGVRVKSRVRAGRIVSNHNQTARGLRVKSHVKAG